MRIENNKKFGPFLSHPNVFLALTICILATAILGYMLYYSVGQTISMLICYPLLFVALGLLHLYSKTFRTEILVSNDSISFTIPQTYSPFGKEKIEKRYSWGDVLSVSLRKGWGLFAVTTKKKEYRFIHIDTILNNNELYNLVQEGIKEAQQKN